MSITEPVARPAIATPERPLKWPLLLVSPLVIVVSYALMPSYTEALDVVGYMLRVTARLAFILLLLAYMSGPLMRLAGVGRGLLQHRRYLGLSMAFAHTVHFYYVVRFAELSPEPLATITVVFGGLAFVLMWLMALTSNDQAMARLGQNWKRLHTFGLHYVWLIFMNSFVGRVGPDDEYFIYAALSLAGLAALVLRVWAYWVQRLRRTT